MRVLCLFFPRLSIQLTLKSRPELAGRPVVLVTSEGVDTLVSAASSEAAARGVVPGLTPAQARRRCANATFLPDNAGECLEELERIASIVRARATTPVAIASRDELLLDMEQLPAHLGHDEALAAQRIAGLVRMWTGLSVRAGVASTRKEAREAARAARLAPAVRPPVLTWDELPVRSAATGALAADVAVPPDASPLAIRARLHRAAARLQTILGAREQSYREIRITVTGADGQALSARRLVSPSHDVTGPLTEMGGWLTAERVECATLVRLEIDRLGPSVRIEPAVTRPVTVSGARPWRETPLRAAG